MEINLHKNSQLVFADLFIEATLGYWILNTSEYIIYLLTVLIVLYRLRNILVGKNYLQISLLSITLLAN